MKCQLHEKKVVAFNWIIWILIFKPTRLSVVGKQKCMSLIFFNTFSRIHYQNRKLDAQSGVQKYTEFHECDIYVLLDRANQISILFRYTLNFFCDILVYIYLNFTLRIEIQIYVHWNIHDFINNWTFTSICSSWIVVCNLWRLVYHPSIINRIWQQFFLAFRHFTCTERLKNFSQVLNEQTTLHFHSSTLYNCKSFA